MDRLLTSFEVSKLYLISGQPYMGKTAFIIQVALNIAVLTKKSVYIQSLDLLENEIVRRMISKTADIDKRKGSREALSKEEKERMYLGG